MDIAWTVHCFLRSAVEALPLCVGGTLVCCLLLGGTDGCVLFLQGAHSHDDRLHRRASVGHRFHEVGNAQLRSLPSPCRIVV